jgi:hypothetical protein
MSHTAEVLKEAESATAAVRIQSLAALEAVTSGERKLNLDELCNQLLSVEENTKLKAKLQGGSIENIGARTATVDEMSTKTQRLLAAAGGP